MTTAAPTRPRTITAGPTTTGTVTTTVPAPALAAPQRPDVPPNLGSPAQPCRWNLVVGEWRECCPHGHVWPPANVRAGTHDVEGHRRTAAGGAR